MAKKRKTRQQKKQADLRHNFTHTFVNTTHLEAKIDIETKENIKLNSPNVYPYLVKDLSKTGLLTTTILGFQLIIFFLLKNHILSIPGLSY